MKLLVVCNMTMHRAKVTLQNNNNMSSCFCCFVDIYYNCDLSVVVFVVFYYYHSFSCLYLPSFYYFHHCIIIAFCCHHSLDGYILAWLVETLGCKLQWYPKFYNQIRYFNRWLKNISYSYEI